LQRPQLLFDEEFRKPRSRNAVFVFIPSGNPELSDQRTAEVRQVIVFRNTDETIPEMRPIDHQRIASTFIDAAAFQTLKQMKHGSRKPKIQHRRLMAQLRQQLLRAPTAVRPIPIGQAPWDAANLADQFSLFTAKSGDLKTR